jgi:hypothetical protein
MTRTVAAILAAAFLAACGADAPPEPPPVVAVHEICTVTIQPDGSIVCECRPKDAP